MIDIALGEPLPSVVIDRRSGGTVAARHLLALGHRAIAEIRGPSDWSAALLRHEGLVAVLPDAGLAPTMSVEGDWTAKSGYAAARLLMGAGVPFSGPFAGNDEMAPGAMRALREHGIDLIDGRPTPQMQHVLAPELVVRSSTGRWGERGLGPGPHRPHRRRGSGATSAP